MNDEDEEDEEEDGASPRPSLLMSDERKNPWPLWPLFRPLRPDGVVVGGGVVVSVMDP